MFVAIMSFFARVSDPTIGGTYMTMLNTITNLGGRWPETLMLWMVDPLTSKQCIVSSGMQTSDCSSAELIKVFEIFSFTILSSNKTKENAFLLLISKYYFLRVFEKLGK